MRAAPVSVQDELNQWAGGIDLQGWVACTGNFRLAVGYTTVFWPRFESVGQYILTADCTPDQIAGFERQHCATPRTVGAVLNHLHIADIQHPHCQNIGADKLRFLGTTLKAIYQAKRAWQFPDRPCTVSFFVPEDPEAFWDYQITFWQKAFED